MLLIGAVPTRRERIYQLEERVGTARTAGDARGAVTALRAFAHPTAVERHFARA
jgi:hypothetical protein